MSASPNTHKNISNPAHSSHHFTSPFPIAVGGDRLHRVQRWSSLPKLSSLHESRWAEPVFKCSVVCGSGGPGLWHVSKYTQTGTEQRPFTTKSFNVKYKTKKGWFVIYHHKFLRIINVVALFFFLINWLNSYFMFIYVCVLVINFSQPLVLEPNFLQIIRWVLSKSGLWFLVLAFPFFLWLYLSYKSKSCNFWM